MEIGRINDGERNYALETKMIKCVQHLGKLGVFDHVRVDLSSENEMRHIYFWDTTEQYGDMLNIVNQYKDEVEIHINKPDVDHQVEHWYMKHNTKDLDSVDEIATEWEKEFEADKDD